MMIRQAGKRALGMSSPPASVRLCAAVLGLLAAAPAALAAGCTADADARKWALTGDAAADTDLSGAACAPDGQCLLVSDEKRRAWFFRRADATAAMPTLAVEGRVKLKPAHGDEEADAEGAAYMEGRFYAIGSHGASRRKGEFEASRYSVYRIDPDGRVEASSALAALIADVPGIEKHFCTKTKSSCEPLQEGGANIEGIAARGGELYIGFRAPAPGGKAFILRVAEKALFGHADAKLRAYRVDLGQDALGRDLGIRDIAAVRDGFLILAGPSLPEGDEAVGSGRVFHWREAEERPRLLRQLTVVDKGVKPEVLLVLTETPGAYRTLVMCDGVAGGAPAEYEFVKP